MSTRSSEDAPAKRSYNYIPAPIQERAVDLVINQGWKVAAAAKALGVKSSILSKFIQRFRNNQGATPARPRGQKPRLTNEEKEKLCDWIDSSCIKTLSDLAEQAKINL